MSTAIIPARSRQQILAQKTLEVMQKFNEKMAENSLALVKDILMNMPDYSSEWINCTNADHDKSTYTFQVWDPDEDEDVSEERTVTAEEVAQAIPLLYIQVQANPNWLRNLCCMEPDDFFEPGCWDLMAVDVLMQTFFYGDIVYS